MVPEDGRRLLGVQQLLHGGLLLALCGGKYSCGPLGFQVCQPAYGLKGDGQRGLHRPYLDQWKDCGRLHSVRLTAEKRSLNLSIVLSRSARRNSIILGPTRTYGMWPRAIQVARVRGETWRYSAASQRLKYTDSDGLSPMSPTALPAPFVLLPDVPEGSDRQFVHRPVEGGLPEQRHPADPRIGNDSPVDPSGHRAGRDAEVLGGLPAPHVVGNRQIVFHGHRFRKACEYVEGIGDRSSPVIIGPA